MKRIEKKWNTLDLNSVMNPEKKMRQMKSKKSSIHEIDLEEMITNRLNNPETKSIFFIQTNMEELGKQCDSPTKQSNLPMLTTISKQLYKKKKKYSDDGDRTLPLSTSFARALASYKSRQNGKDQLYLNHKNSERSNKYDLKRYNKVQFNKQEVIVGNRTTFYKKSKNEEKNRYGKVKLEKVKGDKVKINKMKLADDLSLFCPWEIQNEELFI